MESQVLKYIAFAARIMHHVCMALGGNHDFCLSLQLQIATKYSYAYSTINRRVSEYANKTEKYSMATFTPCTFLHPPSSHM